MYYWLQDSLQDSESGKKKEIAPFFLLQSVEFCLHDGMAWQANRISTERNRFALVYDRIITKISVTATAPKI
jgi:hypothetical protein